MEERPLITFALFAYNQEQFIEDAVKGALAQTYSPLEIILSDDCSSDRTYEIMELMANDYQGPHKIILNRNHTNLGLCPHVNKVFEMASAEIVVVAAGDDISFPDRVENTWPIFANNPDVLAMNMPSIFMDTRGVIIPHLYFFSERKYTIKDYLHNDRIPNYGASAAYRKILFETFGPLSSFSKGEDEVLLFRSILIGAFYHLPINGIYYIHHGQSMAHVYNFDFQLSIYIQNKMDLEHAVNKNLLIDSDIINKIVVRMRNRIERFMIQMKYDQSRFKLLYFIYAVIPAKCYLRGQKRNLFIIALSRLLPEFMILKIKKILISYLIRR